MSPANTQEAQCLSNAGVLDFGFQSLKFRRIPLHGGTIKTVWNITVILVHGRVQHLSINATYPVRIYFIYVLWRAMYHYVNIIKMTFIIHIPLVLLYQMLIPHKNRF